MDNWSQLCYEKFMIRAKHIIASFCEDSIKQKHKHYLSWWTKIHRWSLPPSALGRLGWKMTIRHSTWCVTPVSKSPHVLQSPVFVNWKWLFPRLYLPPIQSCLFQWTINCSSVLDSYQCIWEHLKQSPKGLCSALYEYSTIFLHVKIRDYPEYIASQALYLLFDWFRSHDISLWSFEPTWIGRLSSTRCFMSQKNPHVTYHQSLLTIPGCLPSFPHVSMFPSPDGLLGGLPLFGHRSSMSQVIWAKVQCDLRSWKRCLCPRREALGDLSPPNGSGERRDGIVSSLLESEGVLVVTIDFAKIPCSIDIMWDAKKVNSMPSYL